MATYLRFKNGRGGWDFRNTKHLQERGLKRTEFRKVFWKRMGLNFLLIDFGQRIISFVVKLVYAFIDWFLNVPSPKFDPVILT